MILTLPAGREVRCTAAAQSTLGKGQEVEGLAVGGNKQMMRTYTAKSLRQFIKRIEQIKDDWMSKKEGTPDLWFRGSQNSSWVLVPKLYRRKAAVKDLLEIEDEIREEFVRRAPSLTAYNPRNAWEWYPKAA